MALTQMQVIQSLGEAMAWLERELGWGVPPTELRHLCGRIGELYAALITNGRMATEVNQRGYDVVSGAGERVSVKTTAMMTPGGHVSFNPNTLSEVDRVLILRINTEEMQVEELLDAPRAEAEALMGGPDSAGRHFISLPKLVRAAKPPADLKAVRAGRLGEYEVRELENGSIEVDRGGSAVAVVKPELRALAGRLGLGLRNGNGNPYNTRQLGNLILNALAER